jgi:hypothetical protein
MSSNSNPAINAAFSEVSANPPKVLSNTYKKFGPQRAQKQKIAIALSKARRSGARIPNAKMSTKAR